MDGEEWKCVAPCAPDLLIRVNTMCECLREWGSITNISLNICFTKREDLLRGHLFTYKFISSFLDHIIFNFYLPIWHLHIIHVNKIMATDRLFFKHACRQSRKNIDWHRSNIFWIFMSIMEQSWLTYYPLSMHVNQQTRQIDRLPCTSVNERDC